MPGVWNERLGWLLILAGFLAAVVLDPWALGERDPSALRGSVRMLARHAQGVVLAMGFLQIAAARLLREEPLSAWWRRVAGLSLVVGTLIYALGYVGVALWPGHGWLVPPGAAINLCGFAVLSWAAWRATVAAEVRAVLAVFVLGMAIDLASGLYAIDALRFLTVDLGPEDGVRLRMLRLARVAATALSLLTLMYRDLADLGAPLWGRWDRLAMLIGTVGMPTMLTAACFVYVGFKYLLPIPAMAMTLGVLVALLRARRTASLLEQWGWLLIAISLNVGLIVGLYAFDGPLPPPPFVGDYNEFVRRLSRLGHAYCIVLGMLAILLARQAAGALAAGLLVAGSCVTLLCIGLLMFLQQPTAILALGPLLVVLALCRYPWPRQHDTLPERDPEKEAAHI